MPRSIFAKGLLRYYDPITYDMIFGDDEGTATGGSSEAEATQFEPAPDEYATP